MNAEHRTSVVYTDRERFDQFLAVLPEQAVRDFVDGLLSAELMYRPQVDMRRAYRSEIRDSKTFTFSDPEIQRCYDKFNSTFDALDLFLTTHFGPNNQHPDIYDMYPHLKYTKDEGQKMREGRAAELETLSRGFLLAYEELLTTAMRALNAKNHK